MQCILLCMTHWGSIMQCMDTSPRCSDRFFSLQRDFSIWLWYHVDVMHCLGIIHHFMLLYEGLGLICDAMASKAVVFSYCINITFLFFL